MRKSLFKITLIILVSGLSFAMVVPWSTAAEPQEKADPMAFARGAQSWANNCGRCHNIRDPKDFRDDQWKVIMTHMRLRAGLTGQETRDILLFLQRSN